MKFHLNAIVFVCSFFYFQLASSAPHRECLENKNLTYLKNDQITCHSHYSNYLAQKSDLQSYFDENKSSSLKELKLGTYNVFRLGQSQSRYKNLNLMAKIINGFDILVATEIFPFSKDYIRLNNLDAPFYIQLLGELRLIDPSWSFIVSSEPQAKDSEMVGVYYRSSLIQVDSNSACELMYQNDAPEVDFAGCLMDFPSIGEKSLNDLFERRPFLTTFKFSDDKKINIVGTHVVFNAPGISGKTLQVEETDKVERILKNAYQVNLDLLEPVKGETKLARQARMKVNEEKLNEAIKKIGLKKDNYARFAEVIFTLNKMDEIKNKISLDNQIFIGDFNLDSSLPYWGKIKNLNGNKINVLVDQASSLSQSKVKGTKMTNGVANSYDHFIFDDSSLTYCQKNEAKFESGVLQFTNLENKHGKAYDSIFKDVQKILEVDYLIRPNDPNYKTVDEMKTSTNETASDEGGEDADNDLTKMKKEVIRLFDLSKKKKLKGADKELFNLLEPKLLTHRQYLKNRAIPHQALLNAKEKDLNDYEVEFLVRAIYSQIYKKTFYRYYAEALSDNFPVYFNCKF